MFNEAVKTENSWAIRNSRGHSLLLPCSGDYAGFRFAIGVLGTRTRTSVKGPMTRLMAEMLASIGRPAPRVRLPQMAPHALASTIAWMAAFVSDGRAAHATTSRTRPRSTFGPTSGVSAAHFAAPRDETCGFA